MYKVRIVVFISLIFSSCITRMKINVDIFDKSMLINSKIYKDTQAFNNKAITCNKLLDFKTEIYGRVMNILKEFSEEYMSIGNKPIVDDKTIELFSESFVTSYLETLKSSFCTDGILDVSEIGKAEILLESKLNELSESLASTLKVNIKDTSQLFMSLKVKLESEIKSTITNGIYGDVITGDPLASFVVSSPNEFWNFNLIKILIHRYPKR